MSTQAPPANTQLPLVDGNEAYAHLYQAVYAPPFFAKLASDYGYTPATPEEAQSALENAAKLRQLYDAEMTKAAAAPPQNPMTGVTQRLDRTLVAAGMADQTSTDAAIKEAAASMAARPDIAQAMLSLFTYAAANQSQPA